MRFIIFKSKALSACNSCSIASAWQHRYWTLWTQAAYSWINRGALKRSRLISNTTHHLLLCSLLLLSSCAQLPSHFYDLTNQQKIATEELIQQIGDHRIIFIGEAHDSEIDHKVQLEVIRQLHESGRQVIIALEALPAQQNSTLKSWYYGHASESSLIKNYYLNWTVPYPYYADIFRYAQSQRIKLIGLNLTRKKIRAVINNGVEKEPIEQRRAIKFSRCEQEPNTMLILCRAIGGILVIKSPLHDSVICSVLKMPLWPTRSNWLYRNQRVWWWFWSAHCMH